MFNQEVELINKNAYPIIVDKQLRIKEMMVDENHGTRGSYF